MLRFLQIYKENNFIKLANKVIIQWSKKRGGGFAIKSKNFHLNIFCTSFVVYYIIQK